LKDKIAGNEVEFEESDYKITENGLMMYKTDYTYLMYLK